MSVNLQQFEQDLTYRMTAPIDEILQDLDSIAAFDRVVEAKLKRFNWMLGIAIVGIFLSFFLIAFGIGVVTLVISAGVAIFAGIQRNKYAQLNVVNYRYEVLRKILELISRDIDSTEPIIVILGCNSATHPRKKTETVPHPTRNNWKIDRFRDLWLQLNGAFLDGTAFSLTATELTIKQYGWTRSRSGKSKHKSKIKPKGLQLELSLKCPRRKYAALSVLKQDARDAIKLPTAVELTRLKVTDHRLELATKTPAWIDASAKNDELYQAITMMFLSLYQILNLARTLTKKAEA